MGQKERLIDTNNLPEERRASTNRRMLAKRRKTDKPPKEGRFKYDVLSLNGSGRCSFQENDAREDKYDEESFA